MPRDGSSKGSGPVGRTPVTPPSRSTVPIVGDRPPVAEVGTALSPLPEVARSATGLLAPPVPGSAASDLTTLPASDLTNLPATGLAALSGTALTALPATEAVVVLSQAVLRPVLVTAVAAVRTGVATAATPVTRLTGRSRHASRPAGGFRCRAVHPGWTDVMDVDHRPGRGCAAAGSVAGA